MAYFYEKLLFLWTETQLIHMYVDINSNLTNARLFRYFLLYVIHIFDVAIPQENTAHLFWVVAISIPSTYSSVFSENFRFRKIKIVLPFTFQPKFP